MVCLSGWSLQRISRAVESSWNRASIIAIADRHDYREKLNVTNANLTMVIRFEKAEGLYEPLNSDISKKYTKKKKQKQIKTKHPAFILQKSISMKSDVIASCW